MKKKISSYNDGVVQIYKRLSEKNIKSMEDLEYYSKLPYDEKTIRQGDMEFAEQIGEQITLKICTPDDGDYETKKVAMIGNVVFAIIHIDRDKKYREKYIYLREVRRFA